MRKNVTGLMTLSAIERAIEEAKPSILYGDEYENGWSDSAERYETNLKELLK